VKNLEMKDYLFRPSDGGAEEEEREKALRNCPTPWQVEHDESCCDLPKLQEIVRKFGTRQMLRDMELAIKENSTNDSSTSIKDATDIQVLTLSYVLLYFLSII
jgi:hypothetical protein